MESAGRLLFYIPDFKDLVAQRVAPVFYAMFGELKDVDEGQCLVIFCLICKKNFKDVKRNKEKKAPEEKKKNLKKSFFFLTCFGHLTYNLRPRENNVHFKKPVYDIGICQLSDVTPDT